MALNSKIEWTEATWNPATGCTKISPGCKYCYAERIAHRLRSFGQPRYINGFELTLHEDVVLYPLKWKKPKIIFVNSMSDLFHENIPLSFIKRVFDVMNNCPQHIFQILTKRSNILKEFASELTWTSNIWMGISVEDSGYINRINDLVDTSARIKFISFEPLLSNIERIQLDGINWVIVGGESGPNARPMKKEWVESIKDNCFSSEIPFFFKQWGGVNKKKNGRILDGKIWDEMPEVNFV